MVLANIEDKKSLTEERRSMMGALTTSPYLTSFVLVMNDAGATFALGSGRSPRSLTEIRGHREPSHLLIIIG